MNVKILVSVFIIVIVSMMVIRSLNFLIKDAASEIYEDTCKTVYRQTSDRNIVLRIDDIQAYYLADVQMKMIKDALARNKTLSLSVIPFNLFNDREIVRFLRENKCFLEICLHGYNNTDFEFSEISYNQADEKIKDGLEILNQIEPHIVTFIPPGNEISNISRKAVFDNNINIVSSGFKLKEFGFSVSTYDWKTHKFANYREVLKQCNADLDKNETCIIMIHPQDYVSNGKLDLEKYEQYINLLEGIDDLNATVVTFRDLYYKDVIRLN
jgi:predicted deacetylase